MLMPVEPGAPDTAASLRALRPSTLSWSNLPDYYAPADFHRMARACAPPVSPSSRARKQPNAGSCQPSSC